MPRGEQNKHSLLIASILGRSLKLVDLAVTRFADQVGTLAYVSEPLSFHWTDYYQKELGDKPARRLLALNELVDTSMLPEIKRTSNRLEIVLSHAGLGRVVNIDPGCLGSEQLILASTKSKGHRIHLGKGIYAELTLIYGPEGFIPLPWTYPDYASMPLREIFGQLRVLLLETIRFKPNLRNRAVLEQGERCSDEKSGQPTSLFTCRS